MAIAGLMLLNKYADFPAYREDIVMKIVDSPYNYIPFFIFAVCFFILGIREMWARRHVLAQSSMDAYAWFHGKMDSSILLQSHVKRRDCQIFLVVRYYIILVLVPVSIFLGMYALDLFPFLKPMPRDVIRHLFLVACYVYTFLGALIHLRAFLNANPYATIKWLCLNARQVTKKILLNDMSMMSPQQRQRYQQGRIISSAVTDAMNRHDRGITDDFYIGY